MNRKDVINFAPTGAKKRRNVPSYVGLIIGICLAAFAVSVFVILAINDFDISKALGARQPVVSEDESSSQAQDAYNGISEDSEVVSFLVLCSEKNELLFAQLISVDAYLGKFRIKPVSLDYELEFSSGKKSISEAFRNESMNSLKEAFQKKKINVVKYVHVTEDNLRRLLSNLGPVTVQVSGNYEFNIDAVKYTFSPGTQSMTSDMLVKYMKFAEKGEAAFRLQAHTVAAIFRQHFTLENYLRGESFFSMLINLVDTDITAFDYSAASGVLSAILGRAVEITVVS